MEKIYHLSVDNIQRIDIDSYDDDEFAIARLGFLAARPNAHKLEISEKVLRESAPTALGKWVVADMTGVVDASTHTDKQKIVGSIPKDQEVEFAYDEDGFLRAYVDAVISKIYAADFCKIFDEDNERSVSVEMNVNTPEDNEHKVLSFRICGITVLGKTVRPSCPQSDITFTRFSAEEADDFFAKARLTTMSKFIKERKELMADKKTYKIDKSAEAVSNKPWGDVDKIAMRNKIMEAANRDALVKAVYMKIEAGWEDAPSEGLKYPVMELKGDTFVYNRGALSSALGYAKKENETAVVNKIEAIYKKLNIDSNEKEEDAEMVDFAAIEIRKIGEAVWEKYCKDACCGYVEGVYKDGDSIYAILCIRDEYFRVDIEFDQDNCPIVSDTKTPVAKEFVTMSAEVKFADSEYKTDDVEDDDDNDDKDDENDEDEDEDKDDEPDTKMSEEEMTARISQLEADIENRDNIIMEKDALINKMEEELSALREFKAGVEKKEQAMTVESILAEVEGFLSEEEAKAFREEGLNCKMDELSAWTNKVKAVSFEAAKGKPTKKEKDTIWSFAAPVSVTHKSKSVWDD